MTEKEHTWNHRVIRHVTSDPLGYADDVFYQIHEVHYEDGVPCMVTDNGVAVGGESIEELQHTIDLMFKATKQPVIDMSYFDKLSQTAGVDDLTDKEKADLKEELNAIKNQPPEGWEDVPTEPEEFYKWLSKPAETKVKDVEDNDNQAVS